LLLFSSFHTKNSPYNTALASELRTILNKYSSLGKIILYGDFNSRFGQLTGDRCNSKYVINSNSQLINFLLEDTSLNLINATHAFGIQTFYRRDFVNDSVRSSIIDLLFLSPSISLNTFSVLQSPFYNDHRPLLYFRFQLFTLFPPQNIIHFT